MLFQAVKAVPYGNKDILRAAAAFQDFCSDPVNRGLEFEMLAIDLVDPPWSRLKIYFRCRETTFDSVARIMTLGGRSEDETVSRGLEDMRRLWKALFDAHTSPNRPLHDKQHRTAGILYNVEFRLGSMLPRTKAYLPVRHYAASDEAIIRGLGSYLTCCQRADYLACYVRAMTALL